MPNTESTPDDPTLTTQSDQPSLAGRAAVGVAWTAAAKASERILQLGVSILLMRLLGPKAFGLIGMVLVFTGFAAVISQAGFGSALVQRLTLREAHRSSVFWLMVAMGVAFSVVFAVISPVLASFYGDPHLAPLTFVLGLVFIFQAPGVVSAALLQKEMRFDRIAAARIVSVLVSGAIAIWLALTGAGVWALVAQYLASAVVNAALCLWLAGWHPSLMWDGEAMHELLNYGAGLTGFNFINYWARSADDLLIGRFMGSAALGLYSRAYALMLLPVSQVIQVVSPVLFPALVAIQDDKERVRRIYLRAMRMITFITFPMMVGLAVVAKPFVLGVLGKQWAPAIPIIVIFCGVGAIQSLTNPVGLIYTSQGRTDWLFWWGVFGSGAIVVAICFGVWLGSVQTVAWSYLFINLVLVIPCIAIPGRLIKLTVGMVARAVAASAGCAAVMGVGVLVVRRLLPDTMSALAEFATAVSAGFALYAGLTIGLRVPALCDVRVFVMQLIKRGRAEARQTGIAGMQEQPVPWSREY